LAWHGDCSIYGQIKQGGKDNESRQIYQDHRMGTEAVRDKRDFTHCNRL
jgi:hypothetical protein